MKRIRGLRAQVAGIALAQVATVAVADRFVATNGNDGADGLSWTTAKQTLQSAADEAAPGETIWVSNGVYNAGAGVAPGQALTNRVCVTNAVALRSVGGPDATFIEGSGGNWDNNAIRGVFLAAGASLAGFTVRGGRTRDASDVNGFGGAVFMAGAGWATNCVFTNNQARYRGGGVHMTTGGVLAGCLVVSNATQTMGGGVYMDGGGTLEDCALRQNRSLWNGGGLWMSGGSVRACLFTNNASGNQGGGILLSGSGSIDNCRFLHNTSGSSGAGAAVNGGTANNCLLFGNRTGNDSAGGIDIANGSVRGCTVVSNSAGGTWTHAGGIYMGNNSEVHNCIVRDNTAYYASVRDISRAGTPTVVSHTCVGADMFNIPHGTDGNITNDPQFVSWGNLHLRPGSPCVHAGDNARASGTDLDGRARIVGAAVDMGAFEMDGFSLWAHDRGLSGAPDALFTGDRNGDSIPNGLEYGFDGQFDAGEPVLTVRHVHGRTTAEIPVRNAGSLTDTTVALEGSGDLSGAWIVPVVPAPDTTGKPADRDWFVADGIPPDTLFFRLRADRQ